MVIKLALQLLRMTGKDLSLVSQKQQYSVPLRVLDVTAKQDLLCFLQVSILPMLCRQIRTVPLLLLNDFAIIKSLLAL